MQLSLRLNQLVMSLTSLDFRSSKKFNREDHVDIHSLRPHRNSVFSESEKIEILDPSQSIRRKARNETVLKTACEGCSACIALKSDSKLSTTELACAASADAKRTDDEGSCNDDKQSKSSLQPEEPIIQSNPCSFSSGSLGGFYRVCRRDREICPWKFPEHHSDEMFIVPHHAITFALDELQEYLESLTVPSHIGLQFHHIEALAAWWELLEPFLRDCFVFEQNVLFPRIIRMISNTERIQSSNEQLHNEFMRLNFRYAVQRDKLMKNVFHINRIFDIRLDFDTDTVLPLFIHRVNSLVSDVMSYFIGLQSDVVPLAKNFDHITSDRLTKVLVSFLASKDGMNIVFLTRWMDIALRRSWIRRYFRLPQKVSYRKWERKFDNRYEKISSVFCRQHFLQ